MKAWWVLLVVPSGCRAAPRNIVSHAPVPIHFAAGQEQSVWPLAVGSEWDYNVDATLGDRDYGFEARVVVEEAHGGTWTVTTYRHEKGREDQISRKEVVVRSDGIFQTTENSASFTPPRMLVKFPVAFGSRSVQALSGPALGVEVPVKQTIQSSTRGIEIAEGVDKRWEAIAVESESQYEDGGKPTSALSVTYWVPKLGPVRIVHETRAQGELLSREVWKLKRQTITKP